MSVCACQHLSGAQRGRKTAGPPGLLVRSPLMTRERPAPRLPSPHLLPRPPQPPTYLKLFKLTVKLNL